jgi:hypothetical protein
MRFSSVFYLQYLSAALVAGLLLSACSGGAANYPQAQLRVVDGKQFGLLKGRRALMAHDPVSALLRKTYEDSILLPLPAADGTLLGKDIPVEPGYYTYAGEIQRQGKGLTVNLYSNNTDDNVKDPVGWNGKYELVSR